MSAKKINPNGLCVKTLRICYQSTGGAGSSTLLVKWPKEGTVSSGKCIIPKITEYHKTENACILSDILEKDVPESYYLTPEKTQQLLNKSLGVRKEYKHVPQVVLPNIDRRAHHKKDCKFLEVRACLTPDRLEKRQNGRRLKENGEPAFTLTNQDRHGILIRTANKKGCAVAFHGDGVDLAYPKSETRRGRVQPQRSNTLTTSDNLGVVLNDGSKVFIRKLTPKECWRLQGFSDAQYEKAAAVNSNSQLYKQAGNAVTVNVVEEIGRHIMSAAHEDGGLINECKSRHGER